MSEGKTYYRISDVLENAERIAQAREDQPGCRKGDRLIGILYNERDAIAVDITSPKAYGQFYRGYSAIFDDQEWFGFYVCPMPAERAARLQSFGAPAKNSFDLGELAELLGQISEAERIRSAIVPH
jgi:hypothetical protein